MFSCDIAGAVSRRLRSRPERLAPRGPRLRGPPWDEVAPHKNRLAVLDLAHKGRGCLDLDAACLATCAGAADRDELVSQIPDLRDLDVDLAEGLVEVSQHVADAGVSA